MRKTPVGLGLVATVVLMALGGCTSNAPTAKPTPSREPVPVIFSGSESGEQDILAPAGSHSATITVVCGGDASFSLAGALNQDGNGLYGDCDGGTHSYHVEVAALRKLHLVIELTKAGRYVVETQFSAKHANPDSELAAQCSAMVTVGSDVFNAEDGFTRGALSLAQWQHRVSEAANALPSAARGKSNILDPEITVIRADLTRAGLAPGAFEGSSGSDYNDAVSIVSQVCSDHGDAIYVNAEYGG
jgi:hypothetical protein